MKFRFAFLAALVAIALVPMTASAQFGGLGKKSKFKTKPIKQLIKQMEGVVTEYEGATENVWTATETVQNIIKPYSEGEFPILTKNWAEVRKSIQEAKDDAAKAAAVEFSENYFKEMIERRKTVEALMADPVKTADIKGKLQVPEKEQLTKVVENLKPVPEKDAKLITQAQELSTKATKAIADLGKQVTKNPLKAGDYKKLIKKLNELSAELGKMPVELNKQLEAIKTMTANIHKLLATE